MRTAPTISVLILSLLWHTFAMAGAGLTVAHGDGIAHMVLHLDNKPHHHHDDGSFHQDDSDESVKHVSADSCANTAGFVPASPAPMPTDFRAVEQLTRPDSVHASPVLEGPRRPPRLQA
jgi:hypothetical protein